MTKKTLYDACVEAGVSIENWCSDLYIPCNEVTKSLIKQYALLPATIFRSNKPPHDLWYNIPFAYTPHYKSPKISP